MAVEYVFGEGGGCDARCRDVVVEKSKLTWERRR